MNKRSLIFKNIEAHAQNIIRKILNSRKKKVLHILILISIILAFLYLHSHKKNELIKKSFTISNSSNSIDDENFRFSIETKQIEIEQVTSFI